MAGFVAGGLVAGSNSVAAQSSLLKDDGRRTPTITVEGPSLLEQAWREIQESVDEGVRAGFPLAKEVAWMASRSMVELMNALGMSSLDPMEGVEAAADAQRRVPKAPDLAMPTPDWTVSDRRRAPATVEPATDADADAASLPAQAVEAAAPDRFSVSNEPQPRLGEGFVNDTPRKMPDGTMFVPKAAQRLYRLRTEQAAITQTPVTAKLDGVVVPDPSRGGQVQATFLGRAEPLETGIPYLGQRVNRGDVLVYLRSSVAPTDRAHLRNEIAKLTADIAITEKKIERLGQFVFVPFREGKIVYERLHLEGLRKQREALLAMLTDRDPIRASATGVISHVNVTAGQIVEARQTLFEIVDPDGLWIEAVAYDAKVADKIVSATAITTDGAVIPLIFVGGGLELKQQAVPLHFRPDGTVPNLMAGKPVNVIIQTGATQPGIVLPNDSVVRTGTGQDIVWEKVGPEQFVSRAVATRVLDGRQLYIIAGLDPNSVVVTGSARLLSQFR
jgi:membrane fusion protein, heavy metal efflux system